jgi:hypothetical protein
MWGLKIGILRAWARFVVKPLKLSLKGPKASLFAQDAICRLMEVTMRRGVETSYRYHHICWHPRMELLIINCSKLNRL